MFSHIIDHRKNFLFAYEILLTPQKPLVVLSSTFISSEGLFYVKKGAIVQGHIIRQESSSNSRMAWPNNPPEFYRPTTNAI